MSVRCTKAVLKYPLQDPTFKAVLFALADFANTTDRAWPSLATLADCSGASRRSVINKLNLAENLGIISKLIRQDISTVYTFTAEFLSKYGEEENSERVHFNHSHKQVNPEPTFFHIIDPSASPAPLFDLDGGPSARGAYPSANPAGPSARGAPKPLEEPLEEPLLDSKSDLAKIPRESLPDQFQRRWNEAASQWRIAKCHALDESLKRKVVDRVRAFVKSDETEQIVIDRFFAAIARSEFLQGKCPPSAGRTKSFRLSIAWALAPANFGKIYNNSYDGDYDDQGNDIRGSAGVGPTAQAVSNIQARFRTQQEQRRGSGNSRQSFARNC